MGWKQSNFSESTLSQAIAAADTTIYIDADEVDTLPSLGVGDKAKMVIFNANYREIVNVTAWNTNGTLTVERAQEGTSARDWAAGTRIVHTPTAQVLQSLLDAITIALFDGTATGTNALTVTLTGALPTPDDGDRIGFRVPNTNTGPVTVEVTNGLVTIGPYDVVHHDGSPLDAGDMVDEWWAELRYNATSGDMVLVSQSSYQYEISKINDGPVDAGNLLPNGDMSAWNQGTSFATPASGTEVADGITVLYDGTIGAFTLNRQDLPFNVSIEGNPKHFLRWDQSSAGLSSTFRKIRIPLRQVTRLVGQNITASAWLKADSARSVTARIIQSFGTGGSPSAEVITASETWNVTTGWTKFDLSATPASILGKTLGSNNDDATILELALPINTSMTIDVAMAMIECGDHATMSHSKFPVPWWMGGTGGSWADHDDFLQTLWSELFALSNITATGFLARNSANTYVGRTLVTASAAGLTIANPAGVAGNPSIDLSTGLVQYAQDPMSVAELASITGTFGTAAFVADNTLVHLAGLETITGIKRFEQAVATDIIRLGNTTNTSYLSPRWTDATTFEFVPAPSGTPNTALGHGYDVTNTRWFFDTNLLVSGQYLGQNGTAALPALSSSGDPNTGIFFGADDTIRMSTNGTYRWAFDASGHITSVGSANCIRVGETAGAGAPGYSFINDTNMGLYRIGADNLGISLNGILQVDFSTARVLLSSGIDIQLNSATGPASVTSLGFRGVPNIAGNKNTNYTTVLTDAGACVVCTATLTLTIPLNSSVAYPIGTVIMIENLNGSGNVTVQGDVGVTLRRGDAIAGTGARVVAADSAAYVKKQGTNEWYIYGLFT